MCSIRRQLFRRGRAAKDLWPLAIVSTNAQRRAVMYLRPRQLAFVGSNTCPVPCMFPLYTFKEQFASKVKRETHVGRPIFIRKTRPVDRSNPTQSQYMSPRRQE